MSRWNLVSRRDRTARQQKVNRQSVLHRAVVDMLEKRSYLSGTPYYGTALPAPGTIQAEDYDIGAQGTAYYDNTTGNAGGAYRFENVDLSSTPDVATTTDQGGGYIVGWTKAGEWLEYTLNVNTAGAYDVGARVAGTSTGGAFHIEFRNSSGTILANSGSFSIPNTGSLNTYQNITKTSVSLNAAQYVMRVAMDTNSGSGSVANFNYFTLRLPNVTPSAPSDLAVTSQSSSRITLSWTGVANEAGYKIERSADGSTGWSQVGTTTADVTTFHNVGLTANTTYFYRVRAFNGGDSGYTSTVSTSTLLQDVFAPTKINFQANGSSLVSGYTPDTGEIYAYRGNDLTFGWNKDHTNSDRDRDDNSNQLLDTFVMMQSSSNWKIDVPNGTYNVKVGIGDASFASSYTLNVNGVNYWNNTSLGVNSFANKTLSIAVTNGKITIDNGGSADNSTRINYVEISSAATMPGAPSALVVSGDVTGSATLNWTDNSSDELGFKLEQSSDGVNFSQVAMLPAGSTSFTVSDLVPTSKYYFRVRTFNLGWHSDYSNVAYIPPEPNTVTASAVDSHSINVMWEPAQGADGYRVYRSLDGTTFSEIATVSGGSTQSYLNTDLTDGTKYWYRVRSYTLSAGNAASTNKTFAITPLVTPEAPQIESVTNTSLTVSWAPPSGGADAVRIEHITNLGTFESLGEFDSGTTSLTITGLKPSDIERVRVVAINDVAPPVAGPPLPSTIGTGIVYNDETRQIEITLPENANVSSLNLSQVWITNLRTQEVINLSGFPIIDAAIHALEHKVFIDFRTIITTDPLPNTDGNYEAFIPEGAYTVNGSAGSEIIDHFFVLSADVTRDRFVDTTDFNIMAGNWSFPWSLYRHGDVDYNGIINKAPSDVDPTGDIAFLMSRWGVRIEPPPNQPTGITLTSSSSAVAIAWTRPGNTVTGAGNVGNRSVPITGYRIYRSTGGAFVEVAQINDPAVTQWTDTQVSDGTRYQYQLRSVSSSGLGVATNSQVAVTALVAPTNLQISEVKDDRVTLAWQDNSSSESGFIIQRAEGDGEFTDFQTVPANTTSLTPTGLNENTNYRWRVVANSDIANVAASSDESQLTKLKSPTDAMASLVESSGHLRVDWTNHSSAQDHVVLIRQELDEDGVVIAGSTVQVLLPRDACTYEFDDTQITKTYQVTVQATNDNGNASATTAPAQAQVEPTNDWTTVYSMYGIPEAPSYVQYEWTPGETEVNPVTGKETSIPSVYGNETVTLSIKGLPRHTWARVGFWMQAANGAFYDSESTSNMTVSADNGTIHFLTHASRYAQWAETYWYLDNSVDAQANEQDAFRHTANALTLKFDVTGFPQGWWWEPGFAFVQTYLPHVSLAGAGTVVEDKFGGDKATFTVSRPPAGSPAISATSLVVNTDDAGGTAKVTTDYSEIKSIQIPSGNDSGSEDVAPRDDDDYLEDRFETVKLKILPSAEYALANPNGAPAETQIRDEDWAIVKFELGFASQDILYDTGPDPAHPTIDRYSGNQWIDINPYDGKSDVRPLGTVANRASGELGYPISVSRNTPGGNKRLSATTLFEIVGNPLEGAWQFDGSITGNLGGTFTEQKQIPVVAPPGQANRFGFAATESNLLPDVIGADWLEGHWSLTSPDQESIPYVGTTKNCVYVTGIDTPSGAYETVLDIGCTGASSKRPRNPGELEPDATNNDLAVLNGVFNEYRDWSVKRVQDNVEMDYTHIGNRAVDFPDLLKDGIGQCTAWAQLLVATTVIHGITGSPVSMWNPNVLNGVPLNFVVKRMPAQGTGKDAAGHQLEYGVREFRFHQVVEYSIAPNVVYDPSYGVTATGTAPLTGRHAYETLALDGIKYLSADGQQVLERAEEPNALDLTWS